MLRLLWGVEYIYKGDATVEAALGFRQGVGSNVIPYGVELSANSNSGFGLSVDVSTMLTKTAALTFGGSYYSNKSLIGERLIGKYLEGGIGGYELWGRLTLSY